MKEESIFLDLDPYGVKTFNAFQGGLAINAVDSERTGQVNACLTMLLFSNYCAGLHI